MKENNNYFILNHHYLSKRYMHLLDTAQFLKSWKQIEHCYPHFLFHTDFYVDLAFDHSNHKKIQLHKDMSANGMWHDLILKLWITLLCSSLWSIWDVYLKTFKYLVSPHEFTVVSQCALTHSLDTMVYTRLLASSTWVLKCCHQVAF